MSENEQAMTDESNVPESQDTADHGASDDLESILKEYDTPDEPQKEAKPVVQQPQLDPETVAQVRQMAQSWQQERRDKDIADSVKVIKTLTGREDVDDTDVEAHLWMQAAKDPLYF